MQKLYLKSEIWFSLVWIIIYVVGTSVADSISELINLLKSLTFALHIFMSVIAIFWIRKNSLQKKYGICKSYLPSSKFLYYIPLIIISTVNFWFGIRLNMSLCETIFYVGSMICVGFLEELIFRGFLFKAMSKNNLKSAIIVSSLTFGIGHFVNLINGNGTEFLPNICQVLYAIAFGYLFVIIFHKGKSLLPCILTHSAINAFSVFSNNNAFTNTVNIIVSVILCVTAISYALILNKIIPETK